MKRNELKDVLQKLTTVYPFKGDKQILLDEWYDEFENVPYKTFMQAYKDIRKTEQYFPTIAKFNEVIAEITHMSSDKAWDICKKFLNANMDIKEYNELKKQYPIVFEIYREHKVSLAQEYLAKQTFVKAYKEAIRNERN